MGCLLVLLSAFAPRLVVIFAWIARPAYFDAVFDTWIFPLIGLIVLPFTTLMWLFLGAPPEDIEGFDWVWIGLAVALDLGNYASGYKQRGAMQGGSGEPPSAGAYPPPSPMG